MSSRCGVRCGARLGFHHLNGLAETLLAGWAGRAWQTATQGNPAKRANPAGVMLISVPPLHLGGALPRCEKWNAVPAANPRCRCRPPPPPRGRRRQVRGGAGSLRHTTPDGRRQCAGSRRQARAEVSVLAAEWLTGPLRRYAATRCPGRLAGILVVMVMASVCFCRARHHVTASRDSAATGALDPHRPQGVAARRRCTSGNIVGHSETLGKGEF